MVIHQQYCYSNNGDVNSGYFFINSHTLYQCEDTSTFKDINGDVEKGDFSSGYGYMSSQTDFKHNGLKPLMNYNDRNDTYMNAHLQNGDVSCGIG